MIRLDGTAVSGVDDLIRLLDRDRIGRTLAMDVLRLGRLREIEIHPCRAEEGGAIVGGRRRAERGAPRFTSAGWLLSTVISAAKFEKSMMRMRDAWPPVVPKMVPETFTGPAMSQTILERGNSDSSGHGVAPIGLPAAGSPPHTSGREGSRRLRCRGRSGGFLPNLRASEAPSERSAFATNATSDCVAAL